MSHGGRKRRRVIVVRSPKWEPRREARFSPASFASGGPSLPMPYFRESSGERMQRAEKTFRVNEHGAAKLRYEGGPRAIAERHRAGLVAALGNGGARVLELKRFRSAEVDRTHRRSRRPWALPSAPRTRAA